jgi:hypothetical protein
VPDAAMLPEKRSEGVFYELYTVMELISQVASRFVSVWHDKQEIHKVHTDLVAPCNDLLSAGTGATRVWVVAVCPTTTESDVKDERLGRKEGIDSAVVGRQKRIGSGPGIRIRVTRINTRGD